MHTRFWIILLITTLATAIPLHLSAQETEAAATASPAVEKTAGEYLSELKSFSSSKREAALAEIAEKQPALLPPLLADEMIRRYGRHDAAFTALASYPAADVAPQWAKVLKESRDPELLEKVIGHLEGVRHRDLVPPMADLLVSQWFQVREAAAKYLSNNGDDRMFPVVLRLSESQVPVERLYFVQSMAYLYDRRFFYPLTGMLKDESKSVRIFTMRAIEQQDLKEALHLVRNLAANDTNYEVRAYAVGVIAAMKDYNGRYLVTRYISHQEKTLRVAAIKGVQTMSLRNAVGALSSQLYEESQNDVQHLIMDTLISMNSTGSLQAFSKIMTTNPDERLRIKAAYLLGTAGSAGAHTILINALGDDSEKVRAEAAAALASFGYSDVQEALLNTVRSDDTRYVRSAALFALQKINDVDTIEKLFDAFTEEKDPVFQAQLKRVTMAMIRSKL